MARSGMFNEQQLEQMKKQYEADKSLKKVAASFGVSVPTIAKYLRSIGVEIRGRGRPRKVAHPDYTNEPECKLVGTEEDEAHPSYDLFRTDY